jgi:hypothetical protein
MVSFPRIAIATAIGLAAVAPGKASATFSELAGIRTEIKTIDLPEAPPLPGNQPTTSLQRNGPPSSGARGGWYQTQPSLMLRASEPSPAPKGPQIKYQMFNPNGRPVR